MKLNASLCPSRVAEEGKQPATLDTWIVLYTPSCCDCLPSPFIPHVPLLPSRWRVSLSWSFPVERLTWHLTTWIHHRLKWKIKRGIVPFQFVGSWHLSCWIVSFAGRSMGAIIPQLLCTPELPNRFFLRAAFRRVYVYKKNKKSPPEEEFVEPPSKKIRRTE